MPAAVHLIGSSTTFLVQEEAEAVAGALDSRQKLLRLTRKEGYSDPGGIEGKPLWINPAAVAAVTDA